MKLKTAAKYLTLSVLLGTTTSFAIAQDSADPFFVFFHLNEDANGELNLDPLKRDFSIKNEENYCWMTSIPSEQLKSDSVVIVEKFTTPAPGYFGVSQNQTVEHNEDKTVWTISQTVPVEEIKTQEGAYMSCWTPSEEDPIGNFTLEVTAGDTTFIPVQFSLSE